MTSNDQINNGFAGDYTGLNKVSKNMIPAGNFTTNPWQRGTSFVAVATNNYSADRIACQKNTTAVINVVQAADSPTEAEAGILSTQCLEVDVTTADATIGATDIFTLVCRIEGYDYTNFAQRPLTLSFWVKAVKTGIYCAAFSDSVGTSTYVAEYTITNANTWQKVTVSAPAPPSTGTWNYANGIGFRVFFIMAAGSVFQTTPNAWQTSGISTANQVNGLDSNTNTFKLALIQLESGDKATPYEQLTSEEVLFHCQRYYQKTYNQGVTPVAGSGTLVGCLSYRVQLAGINANGFNYTFKVPMRTAPLVIPQNPIIANSRWYNVTDGGNSGVQTTLNVGDRSIYLSNAQVATDGLGELISIHMTLDAEL